MQKIYKKYKSPKSKNLSFVIAKSLEISGKLDIYDSWVFPQKEKETKSQFLCHFSLQKVLKN
jgi:hypothetical protein